MRQDVSCLPLLIFWANEIKLPAGTFWRSKSQFLTSGIRNSGSISFGVYKHRFSDLGVQVSEQQFWDLETRAFRLQGIDSRNEGFGFRNLELPATVVRFPKTWFWSSETQVLGFKSIYVQFSKLKAYFSRRVKNGPNKYNVQILLITYS